MNRVRSQDQPLTLYDDNDADMDLPETISEKDYKIGRMMGKLSPYDREKLHSIYKDQKLTHLE